MFLHVGDSRIVFLKDLIGIFDLKIKDKEENKRFLEENISDDELTGLTDSNNKSFVVTEKEVFLSPLSSTTLAKR